MMKITNVYGESINLSPAQLREYRKVNNSDSVMVKRTDRLYRIYQLLRERGLITVKWSYSNATEFERW